MDKFSWGRFDLTLSKLIFENICNPLFLLFMIFLNHIYMNNAHLHVFLFLPFCTEYETVSKEISVYSNTHTTHIKTNFLSLCFVEKLFYEISWR